MSLLKTVFSTTGRLVFRLSVWALMAASGLLLIFLSGDLLYSTFSQNVRPWHTYRLKNEFRAGSEPSTFTFSDYQKKEEALFAEVERLKRDSFDPAIDAPLSRFNPAGSKLAKGFDRNWNRSFLIEAKPERGVALLVHGLSDSPYSMRSTAEALLAEGITVYGLRVPGHGTIPAGLDQVSWKDWNAAVALVTKEIQQTKKGVPFFAFGYSTGAGLILKQFCDQILEGDTESLPQAIFLYSPALGITPFARFANLQRVVTGFGILQKARWGNIDLEIDPFKYQSFAKNAGAQLSGLLSELYVSLDAIKERNLTKSLPPIISFQSVVDQTVNANDLIGKLYGVVDNPSSELIFFGLNTNSGLEPFLKFSPQSLIETFKGLGTHNFKLSVVKNVSHDSLDVEERAYSASFEAVEGKSLNMSWPADVFSLSHVSIPFPPEDPVYGYAVYKNGERVRNLGSLQLRGEKGVLVISATDQLRLKSNPFHKYVLEKIQGKIEGSLRE